MRMRLFMSGGSASMFCNVKPKQIASLNDLLATREMKGRELARLLDKTEATVSGWRRGLVPSKENRDAIYAALDATDEEITALGWEKEAVGA